MIAWLPVLLAAGCSDYKLKGQGKGPAGGLDDTAPADTAPADTAPADTGPADTGPADTGPADTGPAVDCTGVGFDPWSWWGSPVFDQQDDPTDSGGRPWYDPDFVQADYSTVSLPDRNITVGYDRVYRTTFDLSSLPPDMSLDLQSDDGIRVYLDGSLVGHWGGDWQQEGCVNDGGQCDQTEHVAPVEVTSLLVLGRNVLAARVSNPVDQALFDIEPVCVER